MAGGMMTNGMVTGGVMSSFGSDPLSDFIMLRSVVRSSSIRVGHQSPVTSQCLFGPDCAIVSYVLYQE